MRTTSTPEPEAGTQGNAGYLILVGNILGGATGAASERSSSANLSAVWWQERPNDPPALTGPCRAELADDAGVVVAQSRFDPVSEISISTNTESKSSEIVGPFTVSLNWARAATTLRIFCGEQELFARRRSTHVPQVNIAVPAENQTLKGRAAVTWNAIDADSDTSGAALQFQVQVQNADKTWSALNSLGTTTAHEIDTSLLSEGSHQLRVMATDGFNTTFALRAIIVKNQ
jgi:hypothetical protein